MDIADERPLVWTRSQKRCPQCGETKPRDGFPRNRANTDGLGAYCKPCHNRRMREAKERLYGSERAYHLWRRYGIDVETYDALQRAQDGRCAICGAAKRLQVDHDHGSGSVRGLLCFNCNAGLGQMRDDVWRLTRLLEYMEGR